MSSTRARGASIVSPFSLLVAVTLAASWWLACGADVDLGGTADGGSSAEASPSNGSKTNAGAACDPCATSGDCQTKYTCVSIDDDDADDADGGNTYCASACGGDGGTCRSDQTCRYQTGSDGGRTRVCAPKTGVCPNASAPSGADGAPLDHCGALTGPNVVSKCEGCHYDCQLNGCYGGWWCNTMTVDCERPPSVCTD